MSDAVAKKISQAPMGETKLMALKDFLAQKGLAPHRSALGTYKNDIPSINNVDTNGNGGGVNDVLRHQYYADFQES
jgi:hypothetical protein